MHKRREKDSVLYEKSKTEMTAIAFKETKQNTQEVQMNAI